MKPSQSFLWGAASDLVQSVLQGDLAGDQPVGEVVVLLLQTEAGLLQPTVLLLQKTQRKLLQPGAHSREKKSLGMDQGRISDQVFVKAVLFFIIHYLKPALRQFGLLGRDLREERTRPIKSANVTFERAGESNLLTTQICCRMLYKHNKSGTGPQKGHGDKD